MLLVKNRSRVPVVSVCARREQQLPSGFSAKLGVAPGVAWGRRKTVFGIDVASVLVLLAIRFPHVVLARRLVGHYPGAVSWLNHFPNVKRSETGPLLSRTVGGE